jgi:hypothetical protein
MLTGTLFVKQYHHPLIGGEVMKGDTILIDLDSETKTIVAKIVKPTVLEK